MSNNNIDDVIRKFCKENEISHVNLIKILLNASTIMRTYFVEHDIEPGEVLDTVFDGREKLCLDGLETIIIAETLRCFVTENYETVV